jgi:predicted phosphodiesterase
VFRLRGQNNVFQIDINENDAKFQLAVMSDVHLDSSKCDQKLFKKHMDYFLDKNIPVYFNGDLFDAVQGKNDRRNSKSEIRKELVGPDHFGLLVDYVANILAPYVEIIAVLGYGNHETAICNIHENDINLRLRDRLLHLTGKEVLVGGYENWIRLKYLRYGNTVVYAHHGAGAGAPVTRGIMEAQRAAAQVTADFIVHGHSHFSYTSQNPMGYLDKVGQLRFKQQHWLRVPGYKEEWLGGSGWAKEKGHAPKPSGCGLITTNVIRGHDEDTLETDVRVITTSTI